MDISKNITLTVLEELSKYGFFLKEKESEISKKYFDLLNIRARGLWQEVKSLSGGNQQKVSIAKWLASNPRILLLDEPTRGIDVGTKAAVHRLMGQLAKQGIAILMISSELPEIIGMSDRILIMHEGILVRELRREEATQEKILAASIGV
jgi:rhamnose transport system ATP-binding protein